MGLLSRFFGRREDENPKPPEQAVIVHFQYGSTDLSEVFAIEEELEAKISSAQAGEYDGNEMAADGTDGYLYMYGPDADKLFQTVKSVLESRPFLQGATVTRRYGPPEGDVPEVTLSIGS